MDILQIVTELKKVIPKENFYIEPETSKSKLSEFERKYNMTTYEFVNLKKDISKIDEDERWEWLDALETYCFFGGIVEGIND
ncbi:hypothetical protein ACQKNX_07915 [Lysinibacillus sp. NPDC093712]|uniref:hypothetical protein n=1 Tax=Lysinibacillus sp. NPDC093712 TaxID=3390579 RepID=UPI003CFF10B0